MVELTPNRKNNQNIFLFVWSCECSDDVAAETATPHHIGRGERCWNPVTPDMGLHRFHTQHIQKLQVSNKHIFTQTGNCIAVWLG